MLLASSTLCSFPSNTTLICPSLILTKDDLEEIQSQLLNWVDKCILFLLFEGVGGYLLKELTFMEWEQVSKQSLKIFFKTGKIINITPQDYEMLRKGFFEDELISFGETSRVSKVTGISLYKQRFNCLSDNSDINNVDDVNRRYRFIQRRLMLISKDLGINITSGSIQESGFLHYIKEGMEETGLDFLQYIHLFPATNSLGFISNILLHLLCRIFIFVLVFIYLLLVIY